MMMVSCSFFDHDSDMCIWHDGTGRSFQTPKDGSADTEMPRTFLGLPAGDGRYYSDKMKQVTMESQLFQ